MALSDKIITDKSSAFTIVRSLRNEGVITNSSQMKDFHRLLTQLTDDKKAVVERLIVEMTIDKGSPDKVADPSVLPPADKQALIDAAIQELEALQPAAKPVEAPKAKAAEVKPHTQWGRLAEVLGASYAGIGLGDALGDFGPTIVSWLRRDNGPKPIVAASAVTEVADEATEVAVRTAERAKAGTASAFEAGCVAVIGLAAVLVLLLMLVHSLMGVAGSVGAVALLLAGAAWFLRSVKRRGKRILQSRHKNDLQVVWRELPVVLRDTGIMFLPLTNPADTAAWQKVKTGMRNNLDKRGFWNDSFEANIDNLMLEAIDLAVLRFGDPAAADTAFRNQAYVEFPEAKYREKYQKPGRSLIGWLKWCFTN